MEEFSVGEIVKIIGADNSEPISDMYRMVGYKYEITDVVDENWVRIRNCYYHISDIEKIYYTSTNKPVNHKKVKFNPENLIK